MGLRAYRFSISWPRVQPGGSGPANAAGLDFYDRLVDGLLERDIEPWVTLYHWDLPQPIEDRGGWLEPDVVERFGEYAGIVARRIGDRREPWITLNEPRTFTLMGYGTGRARAGTARLGRRPARRASRPPGARRCLRRGSGRRRRRLVSASAMTWRTSSPAASAPGSRGRRPLRRRDAPLVPRPELRPRLPRRPRGLVRRPRDARGPRPVGRGRPAAARLPGVELLPARADRVPARPSGSGGSARGCSRRPESGPRSAGRSIPTGCAQRSRGSRVTTGRPAIAITENGAAFEDVVQPDGTVEDGARRHYIESHLECGGGGHRRGCSAHRLLRLVAPRQLRVGARLRNAIRPRPRRLRDAAANDQGERPVVPSRFWQAGAAGHA